MAVIIQVDGNPESGEAIKDQFKDDPRVTVGASQDRLGPETSRNLALNQAQGAVIISLDDDDMLDKQALETWLRRMEGNPEVAWVVGTSSIYYQEDQIEINQPKMPEGICAPGELFRAWESPQSPLPAWPAGLAIRRSLLRQIGGWQALPQGGELGMLVAASCLAPGYVTHSQVHLYRQHPDQYCGSGRFNQYEDDIRKAVWLRGRALTQANPDC